MTPEERVDKLMERLHVWSHTDSWGESVWRDIKKFTLETIAEAIIDEHKRIGSSKGIKPGEERLMTMKLFMWKKLKYLTNSYHCEGGLVVIAADLARARAMIPQTDSIIDSPKPHEKCSALIQEPDSILTVDSDKEEIWVFPDAGCC